MRPTHYFAWENIVFGRDASDAWALFTIAGESYAGLSEAGKIELKDRLESLAYRLEADFQLIRLAREWSADAYVQRALGTLDPAHGHRGRFGDLLAEHRTRLAGRRAIRPRIYLAVKLGARPQEGGGPEAVVRMLLDRIRQRGGLDDPRRLGQERLTQLRRLEEKVHDRLWSYIDCERAGSDDLAYIVRSSYLRGVGEPQIEPAWQPQALSFVDESDAADEQHGFFEPFGHDLIRLHDSYLELGARSLRVETEDGVSHQAMLVVGTLPERTVFPGPQAELLFSPFEEAGFPVDVTFSCEWVGNRAALNLARKRKIDADQIAFEESVGEHGPSADAAERPHQARELEARLSGSDQPPLLRSAVTIAVAGESTEQLEERVERLRGNFGHIPLHRPMGEQHRLFLGMLPAQRFRVRDYMAHLLPEQWGGMVGVALNHAGSEVGPYIGYTLSGARNPIQFDLAEAPRRSRPPTCLLTGSLGSGKTLSMEALLYAAYLQGSRIALADPKGDHAFGALPGVAEDLREIQLTDDERYRGLLDPMRIGGEARADATYAFLAAILPELRPEWGTELKLAIDRTSQKGGRSCGEVLAELQAEDNEAARALARAIDIHASSGLARLGFANPDTVGLEIGAEQVVTIGIRNLALPLPGTARSEMSEQERLGQALLRLLTAYLMRLVAEDPARHGAVGLDEAWVLTADQAGRTMLERLARLGRSQNATLLLASQMLGDAEELEPLVGAHFAFGVETDSEARKALRLLRLDENDPAMVERLIKYRQGRCFFRDFDGRVVSMRMDPGEELLEALDTTPGGVAPSKASGELNEDLTGEVGEQRLGGRSGASAAEFGDEPL
ncbi:MAG: ATP-binding protein [Solirubrobacterales bacterium]